MHSLVVVLPLASCVLAAQHIFDASLSPLVALPNSTCLPDDGDAPFSTSEYRVCPASHEAETASFLLKAAPSWSDPWTEAPICLQADTEDQKMFCIYTSSAFAHNRGISIFTTPALAKHLAQNAAFTNPAVLEGVNFESNPPYAIEPLPGRGMGVIVNRTLHRADTIFSYTPVFIIHRELFELFHERDRFPLQRKAIERLPESARALFLALHGHAGTDAIDDIISTNSFLVYLGENEETHNAVFPETSRLNHDCRPKQVHSLYWIYRVNPDLISDSAHYYFDVHTLTHHVHAIQPIHAGEELTISYIDASTPRAVRKEKLMYSWGFDCPCSLCMQRDIFAEESDNRLRLIAELEEHLGNWSEGSSATPEMAETVISLYEQERLHAPIAIAYIYAALAYNAIGQEWQAVKYARLAVERSILNSGPHFSDVLTMRELLVDPRAHWSWKLRLRK